ncbi:hypothetical protein FACS189490_13100 [Clostridia bacterium]|nr:hypothetical protein FACS189490_13100 [Clostridia bacterium]
MLRYRFLVSQAPTDGREDNSVLTYREEILTNAKKARQAYKCYINSLNISENASVGFFDFVSGGTLQKALQNIVNWDITGLYFAKTIRENGYKPDLKIMTLYGETNGFHGDYHICADYVRMENVMTSFEPYLVGFNMGKPMFANEVRPQRWLDTVKEVHDGILDFATAHNPQVFAAVSKELTDLIYHFSSKNYTQTLFDSPFDFEHVDEFQRHWRANDANKS